MSEPKVLHEWSEDGIDWAIVEDRLGPTVMGRTKTRWWRSDDRESRALAAEILRLRELVGEEMQPDELVRLIRKVAPWESHDDSPFTRRDLDALCEVLLRRKEQP